LLASPLLRDGTSDFIEIDALAAIALVDSGSGASLTRPPPFRADHRRADGLCR